MISPPRLHNPLAVAAGDALGGIFTINIFAIDPAQTAQSLWVPGGPVMHLPAFDFKVHGESLVSINSLDQVESSLETVEMALHHLGICEIAILYSRFDVVHLAL
jgi:hypothetical protein